jgi:predicted AlkP superfamily pyrophosphatase or phosphodiesterase
VRLPLVLLSLLVVAASGFAGESTSVWLVVVDGLGADRSSAADLPRLHAFVAESGGSWGRARAVLPTRTNPNHATLLTGAHPDAHGIVGNKFWDAGPEVLRAMDLPILLEMETLFTVLASERPDLRTAGFFSKAKLRRLFSAAPGRQAAPDLAWNPSALDLSDARVMAAASALLASDPAHFAVITLADVDRISHHFGPGAPEAREAIERVDELVAGLLRTLRAGAAWGRTLVIITADHGFTAVTPARGIVLDAEPRPRGRTYVAEGGSTLVHLRPSAGPLADVAATETLRPGVAAVVRDLATVHLAHPRAGVLLLLADPGHAFLQSASDPSLAMLGNHGGSDEQDVLFVVAGGLPGLRQLPAELTVSLADVAPTVAATWGMRVPKRLDGSRLPSGSAGCVLPLRRAD